MLKSMPDLLGELAKLRLEDRAEIVQRVNELSLAGGRFRYHAEDCDVVCKERLRQFRVEKLKWMFWLHDDEQHAILKQVTSLLWDYALFRTLNDLRVRTAKTKPQGVGFNAPMLLLLDSGFVAKQAMGIRRLIDRSDDVVSLKRLVKDIKEKRELITREVYVAHDGLPYDYAPVKNAHDEEKLKESGSFCFEGGETTGPKAWGTSKRAHGAFDKLSGISSDKRTRNDLIPAQWFDDLGSKFGVCGDVQKFADKFIAHAADSSSRSESTGVQKAITLNKLAKCLRAIVVAASKVSRSILGDGSSWTVPQPQFDPVENFDKGWVTEGNLEEARELWEKHMALIAQWSD
jgi:hypothetical protein